MLFPCLTVFLILLSIFAFLRRRASRSAKEREEAFWDRESAANNTRKADLDSVTYITVTPSDYPLGVCTDSEVSAHEEKLSSFQSLRMLNLNGLSNTDLKLKYGPQNLEALSNYDLNFTSYEQWIYRYGSLLAEKGFENEAIHVLEKGIGLRTDLSGNYLLLGNLYQKSGRIVGIDSLISMAENLSDINRASTIKKLEAMKETQ